MPKYAYSYLLTAMYSADYVDLKGDGPTDDDFGYWVKFNYSRRYTNYSWRVPYQDANYMKNHLSDMNDDKLSYMYGEKEIYYLNSVETKTHAANFILDAQRQDALGAMNENFSSNQTSNQSLNALQSIELVSKKEPTKVLTKVHFEYDYSLCRNTPNSSASTKGKLTLKKLWFTHQGNSKGQLSPYEFSYENVDANNNPYPYDNPNYSQDEMDRWGFYKKDRIDAGFAITANENPYVDQKESVVPVHEYMGAWNLKTIKLPSGGEIRVTYESDDYAYVQDKAAMQMQRIVGTGNVTDVDANVNSATYGRAISNGNKLHDRNLIVFFDLEQTFNATNLTAADRREKIRPYVEGIDELYFKAFLELKKTPGLSPHNSYDYVEGYARPNKNQLWYGYGPLDGNGNVTTGWIRVTAEERNPWNPIGQTDHPFKLAGWQYLRMERQDLFDDGNLFSANNDITQTIQAFVNLANNAQRLLGYFNFCQSRGYCNELYLQRGGTDIIDPKPSWLRLNSPDKKKLGGGHRVKKITIDDDWKAMTGEGTQDFTYGTEYSYTMPDGSSSGVAEYEPLVGGEEIALRLPLRYDERRYPYKNDGLYTEEPFGESLYPGANVGYRRVIVKSLSRADVGVTKNRSGITVNEFYTAKDFPVLVDNTDLGKKNFTIPVIVPFIGEIGYSNKGYSQGFSVELNNMHGQMKGQAVYSSNANINDPNTIPVSKSEYIFLTNNTYDPTQANSLKSRVVVMDADGVYREADLGRTQELSVDRQEHSNFSINAGLQTDAGASPPYITWANALPYFEINSSLYRSVSTLKIIQRNGILSEVRQYKDGAYTSSKNLMYDAETGQPLLTQTTNNFDKPVFNYNYAAHWAYPTMGGAYKNVGAKFFGVTFVNGTYSPSTGYVGDYFTPGDEVEFQFPNVNTREIYWVSAVNTATNEITCMREDGTTSISNVNGTLTILRSGRRNQQSVSNGVIVALKNPVTERRFPLFDAFNQYASNGSHMNGTSYTFEKFYTDCATGQLKDVTITWNAPRLIFSLNAECTLEVVFPANSGITDLRSAFYFDLVLSGNQVVATSPENKFTCQLIRTGSCFKSCMDDVLHAEANRFQDVWSFNYLDNNDPSYKLATSNISTKFSSQLPINAYRFGTKGIWRSKDNWVYQVDRKQQTASASGSNIAIDGVYKHFIPYDWSATNNPAALNPQWTYTGEVTQYSPYGFELESKDALGIYSAALYGYEQSLSVAVGANTMYRELSSDGFEDYTTAYANATTAPHGHLRFVSANSNIPLVLDNQYAHTGNWSLKVGSTSPALMTTSSDQGATYNLFNPQAGQKYQLSLWVKTSAGANGQVQVKNTSTNTVLATVTPDPKKSAIEGWRRIELSFVAPAAGQTIQIELKCLSISSAEVWFDDIRIQPFTSGMKTYVYDLNSLWLLAELDDRNYATFYNYDEEGSLVQVKQETEKGIVTLRTSRGNIKRN